MKKEYILLGPPACGKGTQTNRLAEYFSLPHIDTGMLLRYETEENTDKGIIAKKFIDKGQLVPVELVGEIIKSRLIADDCKNGFILDGFPRSLEQAEILENIRKEIDKTSADFKAVYFDIDPETLIMRIINRRSCPKCGAIYNLKYKKPKNDGICDKCGTELLRRKDDSADTAEARFETYYRETAPLTDYYGSRNLLLTIDASGTIDEVWHKLLKAVE